MTEKISILICQTNPTVGDIDNNKKSYRTTAFLEPSNKFFDDSGLCTEVGNDWCAMN